MSVLTQFDGQFTTINDGCSLIKKHNIPKLIQNKQLAQSLSWLL